MKGFKIKKSMESFKKFIEFRIKNKPGEIDPKIRELCENNSRAWFHFHDKEKRPCLIIKLKYLKHEVTGIDNMAKYALWLIEKGRRVVLKKLGSS